MSKIKHSFEPWTDQLTPLIEVGNHRVKINGSSIVADARILSEPNFQRAMKCVNACAGMDDPESEIAEMRRKLNKLTTP